MDDVGAAASARVERRITVCGCVQGVGFRWFAREAARRLGVTGWARNLADGSVLVEAGGASDALGAFVARLREGPPHARVTDIRVDARATAEPLPDHFAILG